MELVDSLDEMFQWRTPFCGTLLNADVQGSEGTIPGLEAMLDDIEFSEISVGPEQAALASQTNPSTISLWPTSPVSIPFAPSHSSRTIPVEASAFQAPASIPNPFVVNTKPCSVQTGTRGFAIPTPTTPISSAPKTPPAVKPKRSRGSGTAKPKCTPPKKKKKKNPQELGRDASEPKSKGNRMPTTAEHIIRERQRRDDMAAKYSILESLLPPAPKRERAVVVEDAISFVGALEQKKAQLLNRRADLKLMAANNESPWSKKTRSLAPLRGASGAAANLAVNPSQYILTKQRPSPENRKFDSPLTASPDGVVVRADPEIVTSAGTLSAIHVHTGEQEVVMEMVWNKARPNFQSALLQAVQSLGLDVTQCSILRVGKDCIQCVVTCSKAPLDLMLLQSEGLAQRISEIQSSSTLIIGALRHMLTHS